ncbi:outer membrane protein OmpK [Vibrio sp. SS-MA-C1-2]|uniref:nucleoside-specific channel-forming Tsx family protein n=1 Tax=Vibrio sp. SS-MA-C1-2 TaxID=2908646 RepID=UPI001F470EE8|nr:outer membrane protein OmpK [Vibrio sp. SS-MA-C1-2]UJF18846.1 outer membrane protein OmpK [Vibrio sp. SS-MA-C1-2]
MRKTLLALSSLAALSTFSVQAADYSDDIHKNDYKWGQFNLMYALDEKPQDKTSPNSDNGHNYLELEFGGRSGIVDLYGYLDIFNITENSHSDKDGQNKMYLKLNPRFSLDAMTGKDLSFGPVQELYIATLFEIGGGGASYDGYKEKSDGSYEEVTYGGTDTNGYKVGLGSDIMVPWLGKMGLNLYAVYDMNAKAWNGAQISTNWFKPFYTFNNDSFLSFQGYVDWQFSDDSFKGTKQADNGGGAFFGLYWHSEHYAAGYGLKGYKDVYLIPDTTDFASSGWSHYFSVTYKF